MSVRPWSLQTSKPLWRVSSSASVGDSAMITSENALCARSHIHLKLLLIKWSIKGQFEARTRTCMVHWKRNFIGKIPKMSSFRCLIQNQLWSHGTLDEIVIIAHVPYLPACYDPNPKMPRRRLGCWFPWGECCFFSIENSLNLVFYSFYFTTSQFINFDN